MSRARPWFKLYTEARLDRKLAILTLAERGVWIGLLCFAAEREDEARGTFDASDRYALALECADGDEETLNSTIEKLLKVRHLLPHGEQQGVFIFRTFETRQAQKITDFPSDDKERVKERVNRHRATKRQATVGNDTVTSVTSGNDTDVDEEREIDIPRETFSLSGKIVSPIADDAATAAAAGWTEFEARRVGKRVIQTLKLPPSAIDGLVSILQQYPYAPPYLESEAAMCAEWCNEKKRRASLRIYGNWLKEGEQRRLQSEREHQQQHLASMNGNGKAAATHGIEQQQPGTNRQNGIYDPEKDEAFMERRKAARLVRELGQQQTS